MLRIGFRRAMKQFLDLCPTFRSQVSLFATHLIVEPGFGHPQISPYRNWRNLKGLGNLFHRKPAEVAEFHCFAFASIKLLKRLKSQIKRHELWATLSPETDCLIKRYRESCPLVRVFAASMVHEDLPH